MYIRRLWRVAVLASVCCTTGAEAQRDRDGRLSVAAAAGLTAIPDAFSLQCGRNGGGGGNGAVETGVAVIARPWRVLVVQADLRSTPLVLPQGCNLVGFEVDTGYAATDRRDPFTTSTVRVGIETPPHVALLLRATAGVGRIWGSPARPVTAVGVAVGPRALIRRRVHVLFEFDRHWSRTDAFEVTRNFNANPVTQTRRPIVIRPRWTVGRLVLEVPLP